VGWHQVGGAFLGQAADRGRQVTCGEVPERICVNLGIFSKGASQRAPHKHAEPLPKMGPPAELTPNRVGATPRLAQSRTKSGLPADWTSPNQLRATRSLSGRLPPSWRRLEKGLTDIEHMNHFSRDVGAELWGGTELEGRTLVRPPTESAKSPARKCPRESV
jgi:hypothetical protein